MTRIDHLLTIDAAGGGYVTVSRMVEDDGDPGQAYLEVYGPGAAEHESPQGVLLSHVGAMAVAAALRRAAPD